jgi:hypothetical protein
MPEIQDADFGGVLSGGVTSRDAWARTAPEVEALGLGSSATLPGLSLEPAARGVLGVWGEVAGEAPGFVAYFAGEERAALESALTRLPRLAHAVLYVHGEHSLHTSARRSRELAQRGEALRQAGLYWAERAALMGWVDASRVAAIRAGSGFLDLARDLVALAETLRPVWEHVERLQAIPANVAPAEVALRAADLDAMDEVGTQLHALLSGEDTTRPWRAELVGAARLLEEAWRVVHRAWTYHRMKVGGAEVPSLHALSRRGGKG